MEIGMLWFDDDPRTALAAKVSRATDYYRLKYGLIPNLCLVHPSMLNGRSKPVEELREDGSSPERDHPAGTSMDWY